MNVNYEMRPNERLNIKIKSTENMRNEVIISVTICRNTPLRLDMKGTWNSITFELMFKLK